MPNTEVMAGVWGDERNRWQKNDDDTRAYTKVLSYELYHAARSRQVLTTPQLYARVAVQIWPKVMREAAAPVFTAPDLFLSSSDKETADLLSVPEGHPGA